MVCRFENIDIAYDSDADVLYVSFGKPRPAVAMDVADNIIFRFDPFTNELVGITIMDFAETVEIKNNNDLCEAAKSIIPSLIRTYSGEFRDLEVASTN